MIESLANMPFQGNKGFRDEFDKSIESAHKLGLSEGKKLMLKSVMEYISSCSESLLDQSKECTKYEHELSERLYYASYTLDEVKKYMGKVLA